MMDLRYKSCPFYKNQYCRKLNHSIENGYNMFYHGGAIGEYGVDGNIKYPSRCGIEKTIKTLE
jgi:hypothetical protein